MKFDIITIFPDFFRTPLSSGVLGKATESKTLQIDTHDIRDFTEDKHRTVDDKPYGGGSGMLMMAEPVGKAIESARTNDLKSLVILTTPRGQVYDEDTARELAAYDQLIIVCGRYEGIDERVRELYVDLELSIGDYVLSGGEYAACVIVDTVSRHIPGVLGNENSALDESFHQGRLEYPQYTRPPEYKGLEVPNILLSGNHREVGKWRRTESIKKTFRQRPDLLDEAALEMDDKKLIDELKLSQSPSFSVYIALIHYPVYNNRLDIITTAFTNLDIHDIARAAKTYGVKGFYLIHPMAEQQELATRVIKHWTEGPGPQYNTSRAEAIELVDIKDSYEAAVADVEAREGQRPEVVVTDARHRDNTIGHKTLRKMIFQGQKPYLILFGTGWGISEELMSSSNYALNPVEGFTTYNHLSVRSAAAIVLDRLLACKI